MPVPPRGRPRDPLLDERILAATRAAVAAGGYAGMSVDAVAREAGVAKQTLYRRWPRKALLVFDACFGGADTVAAMLPDTGSLTTDLEAVAATQTQVYANPALRELVRGLLADSLPDAELLAELRQRFLQPRLDELAQLVDRARGRGEIRAQVDAGLVAEVMAGTMLAHFVLYSPELDHGFGARLAALVARGAR